MHPTGVIKFKTQEEAIAIANDTVYGLGAGVWTRDMHQAYRVPRAIQAGRYASYAQRVHLRLSYRGHCTLSNH